jgi:hypothetical protein
VTTKLLSAMGFLQGEPWKYDPHSVISSKRVSHGQTPYQHQQKPQVELLANQDSWEEVKNILQIHNKAPEKPLNSPVTQTPQQFEKTYKRKTAESTPKDSGTDEEGSTKRQKLEALEEEEDPELPEEIIPRKKGHVVTIEVTSSEKLESVGSQSETESSDY